MHWNSGDAIVRIEHYYEKESYVERMEALAPILALGGELRTVTIIKYSYFYRAFTHHI